MNRNNIKAWKLQLQEVCRTWKLDLGELWDSSSIKFPINTIWWSVSEFFKEIIGHESVCTCNLGQPNLLEKKVCLCPFWKPQINKEASQSCHLGKIVFWFSALIVQFLPRDILSKTKSIQLHLEREELHLVFQISINPVMRLLLVLDHILIKFLHIYNEVLYVLCSKIWNFHLNIFIIFIATN